MGKDLKNRELGKGIVQRKDGRYTARFVTKTGERREKYFETLPQAREWLEDAKHEDTMDTYVHVTDESKLLAVQQFESNGNFKLA